MEKKANYKAARRALLLSLPLPQIGIVFESPSLCSSANASDKDFFFLHNPTKRQTFQIADAKFSGLDGNFLVNVALSFWCHFHILELCHILKFFRDVRKTAVYCN